MINEEDGRKTNADPAPVSNPSSSRPRKTLGLTGITINAMALIAPGSFMFLLYQSQAASQVGGSADIWAGVLAALIVAFITAQSLGELAQRYPDAGQRGAYHFADHVFREFDQAHHQPWIRAAKLIIGWSAHLYYWLYPGVMVAFASTLANYLFRQFGYHPTVFGQLILTGSFAALIGFLALRGISGSTTSSVVLNVIQIALLLFFSITAILFRVLNPLGIPSSGWIHPEAWSILLPKSAEGLLFQAAIAMVLMVGFETAVALGASAENPSRDIPRASILALVIQGAFAYLLEYFVAGLAFNQLTSAAGGAVAMVQSRVPIGDLTLQIGNALLGGNGNSVLLAISFAIFVALLGSTLTALNTSVRVSFSMAMDKDIPSVLSFLPPYSATPYNTVLLIGSVSAIIGAASILGGLPVMTGIILASNLGALTLYAALSALTIAAFHKSPNFNFGRHILRPGIGLVINLAIVILSPIVGLRAGGVAAQASLLAMGIGLAWLVANGVFFALKKNQ
jgi:basic amino acid/polyamine antiporter, APA family